MPARSHKHLPGRRDQDAETGSALVEATLLIPAAMLLILLAVQACLWARAGMLVAEAAQRGQIVANVEGGSTQAGIGAARTVLSNSAAGTVEDVSINGAVAPGDMGVIRITARAASIIPGLDLPVSAVGVGPKQEFRVSG